MKAKAVIPAAVLAVAAATTPALASAAPAGAAHHAPKPTVVLVHGAFADASGWSGVIERLRHDGYPVVAPANPLRDLTSDAAYISSILDTIPGPVVLVGHSYGGELITNAAVGHANVKALVYIAAFAPDQGESALELTGRFPGSELGANLSVHNYPVPGGGSAPEGVINQDAFHAVFAADVPARTAADMAASQRPVGLAALSAPSGVPAWKTLPSWFLVAGADQAIPPASEAFMAQRANSRRTITVNGASHAVMVSHPKQTADLIKEAAEATG
ncbi:alpha/beta hydrolase [Catenulispora yoronensis]|uniref:Alpha/beta hydrolase n=1 Tax=Catenulispora yoronensis TaxID=450799 RepID=A0ABP5FEV3_9ACTN